MEEPELPHINKLMGMQNLTSGSPTDSAPALIVSVGGCYFQVEPRLPGPLLILLSQ